MILRSNMARAQELENQIEELQQRLEQQRIQIDRLLNLPAGPNNPQPATFDVSRIPDIIKLVPGYDGDVKNLPAWIASVDQKLQCALNSVPQSDKDSALLIWTSVIRDKITGEANETLINNNSPCDWAVIKQTLKDRFADKRDLSTILSKIPYLRQGHLSVEEFYQNCDAILSDIRAKVSLDDNLKLCASSIMDTYEAMLVNAFIDGLYDPISALTRTSKPSSLLSAYQHALDQDNAAKRQKERAKAYQKPVADAQRFQRPQTSSFRNTSWNSNSRGYPSHSVPKPTPPSNNQEQVNSARHPLAIKQESFSNSKFRRQINMHEEVDEEENDEEEVNFPPEVQQQEED